MDIRDETNMISFMDAKTIDLDIGKLEGAQSTLPSVVAHIGETSRHQSPPKTSAQTHRARLSMQGQITQAKPETARVALRSGRR
jgi:hypothetical protein